MKTYAIADLHGRFDLLVKALAAIETHASRGTVVFLGDYIDRGPQSRQVIERLMLGPMTEGWRWVCLKGNHEQMLVDASRDGNHDWWLENGGVETVRSYGEYPPSSHIEWCEKLPMIFVDDHRAYVHAGVDPALPLTEGQGPSNLLWRRYRSNEDISCGRHIVHGHTPVREGPVRLAGRTNLDTGAVFYGRLVIGVFENAVPGGPVDLITIT